MEPAAIDNEHHGGDNEQVRIIIYVCYKQIIDSTPILLISLENTAEAQQRLAQTNFGYKLVKACPPDHSGSLAVQTMGRGQEGPGTAPAQRATFYSHDVPSMAGSGG